MGIYIVLIGALLAVGRLPTYATVVAGDGAEPQTGRACPYNFLSDMPAGEFCIYQGSATTGGDSACDGDVVVIWSTHQPIVARDALSVPAVREVYFGFVDMPSFLIHAIAHHRLHARLRDYRPAPDEPALPLDGESSLGPSSLGARTLTLTLPAPLSLTDEGDCAFDSYRGRFVGVLNLTPDTPADVTAD